MEEKNKNKIDSNNVAILLLICLAIFGAYVFINFAYQATKSSNENQESSQTSYYSETADRAEE